MYDIKTLFRLVMVLETKFGNKRGLLIYHIKLQCIHVCKSNFGISLLGLAGGGGALENFGASNHKNY